jgi:hypothetical protein
MVIALKVSRSKMLPNSPLPLAMHSWMFLVSFGSHSLTDWCWFLVFHQHDSWAVALLPISRTICRETCESGTGCNIDINAASFQPVMA